jgi:dUTP pyrophosphatase
MNAKIVRLDPTVPLPEYKTSGSVALDLASSVDMVIEPRTVALIPTGLIIEVPNGHVGMIAIRSSTPMRKGLILANGIGVVDQDYCGPADEWMVQVYNLTDTSVHVSKGERIAQVMFIPVSKVQWLVQDVITKQSRGGVGSTGVF